MKLTIGFSPCPNDTFIFDALINGKLDTGDLRFEAMLEDVETLNKWAFEGKLDITKLSFPAFFSSLREYILLDAGSALGKGVGPLLISKSGQPYDKQDIEKATIAIPGIHTTANLLLDFAFPGAKKKNPMVFSEIEEAVLTEETELGVIIHENRFTYAAKGLHKVMDLGEYWESKMKIALPLGGIVIRRSLGEELGLKVDKLIRESLEFAFGNYPGVAEYVKVNAQEMSEEVMRKHIDLYVNEFSRSLGEEGRKAVMELYKTFSKDKSTADLFLQHS